MHCKKMMTLALLLAAALALVAAAASGEKAGAPESGVHPVSISELVEMMYAPEDAALAGEWISVTASFGGVIHEGTEDAYCFLVLVEPGACCAESIRFIPAPECTAFPEPNTAVTLTGRLIQTGSEGSVALRIIDATLAWE